MKRLFLLLFFVSFLLLSKGANAVTYVSGCQDLSINNELYIMTSDINQTANLSITPVAVTYNYCLRVNAGNITLDCNGHYIDTNYIASGHPAYAIFMRRISGEALSPKYTNVTIKNCRIYNSDYGIGISTYSSPYPVNDVNILDSHFECNKIGAGLSGIKNIYVDNVSSFQGLRQFSIASIDNGLIVNSIASNVTRDYYCPNIVISRTDGFYLVHTGNIDSYKYDLTLINVNSSYNARHGIYFWYDTNTTIINSTITHNTYDGLNYYQYSIGNTDLTFYNNNISDNDRYGTFLYNTNISAQQNWVCNNANYDFYHTNNTNITPYDINNYCDNIGSLPSGYNWTDYNTTGCTFNCSAPYPPPPPPPPPAPPTVFSICDIPANFFGLTHEGGCLFLAMLIIAIVMANVGYALKKYIPEAVDMGVLITALILIIIFTLINWINIFISIVAIILIILVGYYYISRVGI